MNLYHGLQYLFDFRCSISTFVDRVFFSVRQKELQFLFFDPLTVTDYPSNQLRLLSVKVSCLLAGAVWRFRSLILSSREQSSLEIQ